MLRKRESAARGLGAHTRPLTTPPPTHTPPHATVHQATEENRPLRNATDPLHALTHPGRQTIPAHPHHQRLAWFLSTSLNQNETSKVPILWRRKVNGRREAGFGGCERVKNTCSLCFVLSHLAPSQPSSFLAEAQRGRRMRMSFSKDTKLGWESRRLRMGLSEMYAAFPWTGEY